MVVTILGCPLSGHQWYSTVLDRKGEARLRVVRIGLSSVGETFPKLFPVGFISKVDVDVLASGHEVDMLMDSGDALPKILCANETGNALSDLDDALR